MLLWIIVTYLVIGVLITALLSEGTFWFNLHDKYGKYGWIGYILGMIVLIVIAPIAVIHGTIRWCISTIRKKGVES